MYSGGIIKLFGGKLISKRSKYQKPGREMYLIIHIMRSEAALISTKVVELSQPFFYPQN